MDTAMDIFLKRSIKFELVPDPNELIRLGGVPQYAVMTGNKSP